MQWVSVSESQEDMRVYVSYIISLLERDAVARVLWVGSGLPRGSGDGDAARRPAPRPLLEAVAVFFVVGEVGDSDAASGGGDMTSAPRGQMGVNNCSG